MSCPLLDLDRTIIIIIIIKQEHERDELEWRETARALYKIKLKTRVLIVK